MFDKALEIFKKGYQNNQFECAYLYYLSFIKSDNLNIYNINNFNTNKFINIFQALIDGFVYGEINTIKDLFDFYHIIGKKYNLQSQLSDKYMKYLNEIGEILASFNDKTKGEENMKKFTLLNLENLKYNSDHALSIIYMHGLTSNRKKDLIKSLKYLKKAKNNNEFSKPYYQRLIYKIKNKLFKLGIIEDKKSIVKLAKKVFDLYKKNENYEYYGNSYYYYFGKLYEYGIGTDKNNSLALSFYQKGCKPFHNLYDHFILVYKRYLSLKKVDSMINYSPNLPKYNVIFSLSIGKQIKLPVNNKMSFNKIKVELYKRQEFQNLEIKCFLFQGNRLEEDKTIEKYKIKENDKIVVMVGILQNLSYI